MSDRIAERHAPEGDAAGTFYDLCRECSQQWPCDAITEHRRAAEAWRIAAMWERRRNEAFDHADALAELLYRLTEYIPLTVVEGAGIDPADVVAALAAYRETRESS